MTNLDGLTNHEAIKWVIYKGGTWTIASRLGATRNMYNANKRYITGGQELSLRGSDLVEYKACHLAATGESLKCPTLLIVDRERADACLSYMAGQTTTNGHSAIVVTDIVPTPDMITSARQCTQSTTSTVMHDMCSTAISSMEKVVVDKGVLEDLLKITQDKGLHWVEYGGGIYLPMIEACLAKGVERDDYSSNWQGQLPGVGVLLEGAALHAFKASYVREYLVWPYPRVRSLRIGNWEHAYAYLVQGKSNTATTFQSMGARSIQQAIVAPRCPESWSSEEGLVDRVFKLMELSTISMQREACFYNSLGNTPTTRRVDAIEHVPSEGGAPSKVHIYEFKKGHITSAHVSETVGTKGYVHLIRERYPEAKVCLFMVGNQVDPQAQRLLDCMVGVMYLPLSTLLNRVLASIVGSWPKEGHYQLRTHFLSQFQDILPQEMLSGPILHPQVVATYHKPMATVI